MSLVNSIIALASPVMNLAKEPRPANVVVGKRWKEIQGSKRWAGLLDPLDPVLKSEIVRYGEFIQVTYDSFDADVRSRYCGSCKYSRQDLLEKVGLENRGYEVTNYFYATAEVDLPHFILKSIAPDQWNKDSNWMGYVAVSTSPEEIARLGRRDIVIAYRGTIMTLEWIKDVQDSLVRAEFDPRHQDQGLKVASGFLTLYTGKDANSVYNKTSARQQVLQAVKNLVEKYKGEDLSITVTGHSLGSALATLSAYDIAESQMNLRVNLPDVPTEWSTANSGHDQQGNVAVKAESSFSSDRIPVTVYTFGGPRVGNGAFRDRMDELGVAILRTVNVHDLFPRIPGFVPDVMDKFVGDNQPVYEQVGVMLQVDNTKSPFLQATKNFGDFHNLESYLHLVDGFQSSSLPFKSTGRDIALVNKSCGLVKPEYFIPSSWWQDKNKGLVQDDNGHWVMPPRSKDCYPEPQEQNSS